MFIKMSIVGLAAAAPKVTAIEDGAAVLRRKIGTSETLNTRVNPITQGGTIWRDSHGVARAIIVIQIYEGLLQSFDNSGFNLAKIILAELTNYGRTHGFADIVRRNLWDAEFDARSKVLKKATYMTLALTSRGSVDGVETATELLQSWLEQGGKYFEVRQVDNALAHISRSDDGTEAEEREEETQSLAARGGNYCSGATGGWYNFVVDNIDPMAVSIKVSC